MRQILIYFILISLVLSAQKNTSKKIIRTNYYIELSILNFKKDTFLDWIMFQKKTNEVIKNEQPFTNISLNYINHFYIKYLNIVKVKDQLIIDLPIIETSKKINKLEESIFILKQFLNLKKNITYQSYYLSVPTDIENSGKTLQKTRIENETKSQKKAKTFAKLIGILALAIISILSLFSYSLYKNNILRTQSNLLLKEKNIELQIAKENAEKASKARSEFLSTVSHELRTPLNAINGITHLLLEENPKKSQLDYLKSLKFSGNYLLTFINDILEINRIESDNIPIEQINCNLKVQLANIQNSFKEIAQEKNNTFLLEIDDSIPENIICDPTKISQIFINLIGNSLKFTENGYVKIIAKLAVFEGDEVKITFKVSDNGIGIPDDKQEEIFDSFSQGSIEINRKYGGTGLGLAIVKRLIELLGGSIQLNSKIGLGTTFSFTLPFRVTYLKVTIPEEKITDLTIIKNKKILLVEDNKINQMITKKMLENKGMFCKILDNGEDCVTLLKEENDFDLILMDVHLPGINGTLATKKIRKFNKKIPIIALTAISINENTEVLISYGMNDVITKPFNPENFYKILAKNLV
jgi:signal transduction histidine kinase/CheY-like chemotaxis protein